MRSAAAASTARPGSCPPSTTSASSPIRSASSALTRRPVSISSCEREAPIRRGSSQLVPMSQFDSADVDEGRAEHRLVGRVADVAAEGEREPEPRRRSVDRGDHGLGEGAQPEHERRHVLLVGEAVARFVAAAVAGRRRRIRAGPRRRRSRARHRSGSPRGRSGRARSRAAGRAPPRTARRSSR